MAEPGQPTRFGRIHPPDEAWLAKAPPEPMLDPDLPIIDTHHHLWQRPDHRYLLHELLADLQQRPQRGRHGVPPVPRDVSRRRPGGDAAGRRNRVRRRHRRDERQRRLWRDPGRRRHRGLRRPDAGRAGRGGAGGADPRRRRPVPRRAAFRQLGRRSDHRQRRAGTGRLSPRRFPRRAWRGCPRSGCRWTPGCSSPSWPT